MTDVKLNTNQADWTPIFNEKLEQIGWIIPGQEPYIFTNHRAFKLANDWFKNLAAGTQKHPERAKPSHPKRKRRKNGKYR